MARHQTYHYTSRTPNYRRAFIPGGCWFFTVNLLEQRRTPLVDHVDALRAAFEQTRRTYPFDIAAIVVLPDHLHAVWTLPPADADFSTRWRLIKTRFVRALPKLERLSAVRKQLQVGVNMVVLQGGGAEPNQAMKMGGGFAADLP